MATCGQSSPPTPSVWASTSRTYDWSSTPTSPARWRTTCRKRGALAGTSRAARCVLLYTLEDVERQFGMSARSRLTRQEIQGVLKALRNLDRRKAPRRRGGGHAGGDTGRGRRPRVRA